jgi:hypothetical protein
MLLIPPAPPSICAVLQLLCLFRCPRGAGGVLESMVPVLVFVAAAVIFLSCLQSFSITLPILTLLVVLEVVSNKFDTPPYFPSPFLQLDRCFCTVPVLY